MSAKLLLAFPKKFKTGNYIKEITIDFTGNNLTQLDSQVFQSVLEQMFSQGRNVDYSYFNFDQSKMRTFSFNSTVSL